MGRAVKISLIGAGSGEFSMGIVRDLCLTPGLHGSLVSLMDINEERLNATYSVATRYAQELGVDLKFEKTLDRRASLRGADFVLNTAMVGGWGRLDAAREIGRKWGYYRFLRLGSFDQLSLFMDIIHDMEALCPDAWYIQSANPVFDGITLIGRKSKIKAVGLCHGQLAVKKIARVLGYDPEQIEYQCYGINHFIWLTKFRHHGEDLYPVLDKWIAEKAKDYWATCDISDDLGPKAIDVYKRLGLFPVGDTVTPGGGSSFAYYHTDKATEERWKEDPRLWFDRHIQHVNRAVAEMARATNDPNAKLTEIWPPKPTFENNVKIINALANDVPGIYQGNVPNKGAIPGIPDDVAVDIPALVSAAGIQPLHMEPLPRRIMVHIWDKIGHMERNLEVFESRDKGALLELLLANPETHSIDQARGVLEELLELPANANLKAHLR